MLFFSVKFMVCHFFTLFGAEGNQQTCLLVSLGLPISFSFQLHKIIFKVRYRFQPKHKHNKTSFTFVEGVE